MTRSQLDSIDSSEFTRNQSVALVSIAQAASFISPTTIGLIKNRVSFATNSRKQAITAGIFLADQ